MNSIINYIIRYIDLINIHSFQNFIINAKNQKKKFS